MGKARKRWLVAEKRRIVVEIWLAFEDYAEVPTHTHIAKQTDELWCAATLRVSFRSEAVTESGEHRPAHVPQLKLSCIYVLAKESRT
jgi:hypothetical protein